MLDMAFSAILDVESVPRTIPRLPGSGKYIPVRVFFYSDPFAEMASRLRTTKNQINRAIVLLEQLREELHAGRQAKTRQAKARRAKAARRTIAILSAKFFAIVPTDAPFLIDSERKVAAQLAALEKRTVN